MVAAICVFTIFTLPGVKYANWALNPVGDIEYCQMGNFSLTS